MPNKSYSELMSDYFSLTGRGKVTDDLFRTLDKLGLHPLDEFMINVGDGVLSAGSLFAASQAVKDKFGTPDVFVAPPFIIDALKDMEDDSDN
jgi:hypothetical protein